MKKKIIFFTIALILTLPLIFYFFSAKKVEAQLGQMPAPEVLVLRVEESEVEIFEELPARVVSARIAEIRPQISGIIKERKFEEGAFVKEGQQLYQIEPNTFLANFESSKAGLRVSRANLQSVEARYKRYEELVKIEAISKQEFDDVKAELESAKADASIQESLVKKAQIEFDYTKVFAPISGKIGKSYVTKGALVSALQTQVLTVITQLDPIYVDISQPNADMFKMQSKIGDKKDVEVELIIPDHNKPYETLGKLQFSESIIDESTGAVSLRAVFENKDGLLLPGLFVRARIKLAKEMKILAPQNAVQIQPDGSASVWVVDDKNIVLPRKIEAKTSYGNNWIVDSGLNIGDVIVLEGFQKIMPNAKVSPVLSEKKAEKKDEVLKNENPAPIEENKDKASEIIEKKSPEIIEEKSEKAPQLNSQNINYDAEIKKYIEDKINSAKSELKDTEKSSDLNVATKKKTPENSTKKNVDAGAKNQEG